MLFLKQLICSLLIFSLGLGIKVAYADIAFSGQTTNSIKLSTEKFEDTASYTLIIHIKGIDPKEVVLIPSKRGKLIMLAQRGNINGDAIAGGQSVRYSFSFGKDADFNNMKRVNTKNKVIVTIPKQ